MFQQGDTDSVCGSEIPEDTTIEPTASVVDDTVVAETSASVVDDAEDTVVAEIAAETTSSVVDTVVAETTASVVDDTDDTVAADTAAAVVDDTVVAENTSSVVDTVVAETSASVVDDTEDTVVTETAAETTASVVEGTHSRTGLAAKRRIKSNASMRPGIIYFDEEPIPGSSTAESTQPVVQSNTVDGSKSIRLRKRRKPDSWKANIVKKRRRLGKEYMRSGIVHPEGRQVQPGCDHCRLKCHEKITEVERLGILNAYWELPSNEEKWMFIINHSDKYTKRRTTTGKTHSRRSTTYAYYLESENARIQVCKKFFLATLHISDKVVIISHRRKTAYGTTTPDMRGKIGHRPRKEADRVSIREHIALIDRVPSHYTRKDSAREYISGELNLRKIYDLYMSWCAEKLIVPCKRSLYEHVFRSEYNISFHSPKKDQCEYCTKYANSTTEQKAEMQQQYDNHQRNKVRAREAKDAEKARAEQDATVVTAVYDLEQVLQCPALEVSVMYYKRKLSVYNFTVYELATHDGHCFMWHEGQAKRGGNDIATCVYNFSVHKASAGAKELHFFSDQCMGQNKNQFIAFMYYFITCSTSVEVITHSYLECGHTMNEGDSMHSTIESAKKNQQIFCPEQYYFLARAARKQKPYIVHEMTTDDFIDFERMTKIGRSIGRSTQRKKESIGDTSG